MKRKSMFFVLLIALLFSLLVSCNSNKSVKITLDSQGGSRCKTITVDEKAESIDLPEPTRERYLFSGWYVDAALTQKVDDPIPQEKFPTEDVTYYAGWTEVVYTVFFFVGEKKVGEKTFHYGEVLKEEDYPSLSSYPKYQWDLRSFEVKSDGNVFAVLKEGGSDIKDIFSVEYVVSGVRYAYYTGERGEAVLIPDDPIATGNSYFYGWSLTENGEVTTDLPTVIEASNKKYYAQFRTIPDSTDYLVYEPMQENGVDGMRIVGLTAVGAYQQELGIPTQINGRDVMAIGYTDTTSKSLSDLRVFKSSTLTSVYLPPRLRSIGAWAFSGCDNLTKVVFRGRNLSYIGQGAFAGCSSLASFDVTAQVTVLGSYVFSGMTLIETDTKAPAEMVGSLPSYCRTAEWYLTDMALSSVSIDEESVLSEIGPYAFYRCKSLETMRLSSVMTEIDYLSFEESGLTSLSFYNGGNLRAVDGVVFSSNGKILYYYPICGREAYTVPSGVEQISSNAFRDNLNLSSVVISDDVRSIGENAFRGCDGLTTVSFSDDSELTTVLSGAFADCPHLLAVNFPEKLSIFRDSVFENDVALGKVTFAGSSVTEIGAYAFYHCISLPDISIPEKVTKIGEYAFYGCSSLENLILVPNRTQLVSIGDYAFCDCIELTTVYLPGTLEYIGAYAFCGLTKKMKMELTSNDFTSLECLGERAFSNTSILEFTLRSRLISAEDAAQKYGKNYTIGAYAFANCELLKTFGFSPVSTYSEVPEGFLYGCTALTGISFTYNIKKVGAYALYGCTGVRSVSFNERTEDARQMIEEIGAHAFEGCRSLVSGEGKSRILPTSLSVLGEAAFKGCTSIRTVVIPERLEEIGKEAFYGCNLLNLISYDRSVVLHTLQEDCFAYCTSLTTVTLPTSLGLRTNGQGFVKNPFFGCTALASFSFNGLSSGEKTGNGLFVESGVIYYQSTSDLYAFPTSKMAGPVEISSRVAVIEEYAFYGATLTELDFTGNEPESGRVTIILVDIGDYAFAESSLKKVNLTLRVGTVGAHAFENCKLTELNISNDFYQNGEIREGVEYRVSSAADNSLTIGDFAFHHTTLTTLNVVHRITTIGSDAFSSCYQLTEIDFTNAVEGLENTLSIGDRVFADNNLLTNLVLPGRLIFIGDGAFQNCYNLESVFFTTGSVGLEIGSYAFSDNHFLYELSLPANVVSLRRGVLSNDTRLKYVYFPEKLTKSSYLEIPEEAFLNDAMLDSLTIPSYVTYIGERAYFGTHLHEIEFEGGMEPLVIGDYAFAEAVNLQSISLPDNCVSIGQYAFGNASKLTYVDYSSTFYVPTEKELETTDIGTVIPEDGNCYVKTFFKATGKYRSGETYYLLTTTEVSGSPSERVFVKNNDLGCFVPFSGAPQIGESYYRVTLKSVSVEADCDDNTYVCRYTAAMTRMYQSNVDYFEFDEAVDQRTGLYVVYRSEEQDREYFISEFRLSIGNGAFAGTSLTTIDINSRVYELGREAFADIPTLLEATIDGEFSVLANGLFLNDVQLGTVLLGENVDTIDDNAFYRSSIRHIGKKGDLSGAALPLKCIGAFAFYASNIEGINILSDQNVTIGESAFEKCAMLTSIVLRTTGTMECGEYAFGDCGKLETLSFTCSSLTLGKGFAYNAVSLYEGFSVTEISANYYVNDHVLFTADGSTIVFYPAGKTGSFCELEGAVRIIGEYAFYGNKYLTGLRIFYDGTDVVRLGEYGLAETEGVIIYVASNLVSMYKNEWGTSDVQAYNINLGGYVLTLQNSGKYYVSAYLGTATDLYVAGSMTGGSVTYEIAGIGKDAFKNNKELEVVTLGAGIKTISNGAFRGCTALRTVNIGENVTGIKNYAFYGCDNLENVNFTGDSSVVSIGNYAFAECKKLIEIDLPKNLETIGSYAFAGNTRLQTVQLSEGLLEIKNNAFEECDSLRFAILPSTVRALGSYLFRNCDRVVYIRCLAETVPTIDEKTFADVPAGIFFFVPGKALNKYNVDSRWRNHIEKLISADYIYDQEGLTEFSKYVLEPIEGNSYRLVAYLGDDSEVVVYSALSDTVNVTAIGENAFGTFVRKVDLRQGIKQIDANAFTYAVNLEEVVIASTVTTIGSYAFANLNRLTKVTVSDVNYVSADSEAGAYYSAGAWLDQYRRFYVFSGLEYVEASADYSATNRYFYKEQLSSLVTIGQYAFYNCTALGGFVFPKSVKSIEKYAFSCDNGLKMHLSSAVFEHNDIDGKNGLTLRIGEGAFAGNVDLLEVVFNCRVTYFGNACFKNCTTMTSIHLNYLPARVTEDMVVEVPTGAQELFSGSEKLSVIVPTLNVLKAYQSKWSDGEKGYAVKQADINKLTSEIYVKDQFVYSYITQGEKPKLTVVGYLGTETAVTFKSTVELASKECTVTRIGRENLAGFDENNCSVISNTVRSVVIPSEVETIGTDAFRNSTGLVRVEVLGNNLKVIEANAFYGCPNLTTVILPSEVASIGDYAFYGCSSLNGYDEATETGMYIKDTDGKTLTLGTGVFAECTGMTFFRMPSQLVTIGNYAFSECVNLASVRYGDNFYLSGDEVLGEGDVKLNKIGAYAFYKTAISEIILPETVTIVDQRAFAECQKLLAVYLFRDPIRSGYSDVTSTYRNVFEGIETSNTKIYVPIGTVDRYKSKDGWNTRQVISRRFYGDFAYEINGGEEATTSGSVTLTAYRGTEKNLVIPDSLVIGGVNYDVSTIGPYFGTPNLERVIFSSTSKVFNIGEYAFAGCTALEEIRLPGADRITSEVEIGGHAFENCTSLKDVHLPLYLTYLSSYLFFNCTALEELTLPTRIGEDTGKSNIIMQNGGIIGNGLFFGCTSLSRLRILFVYPVSAKINIYGSNVFTQAGTQAEGGLNIIVPAVNLSNFANNWVAGSGEKFTFHADNMLFGDYLMQTDAGGYDLVQYRGDVDVVDVGGDFGGKEIVSISDTVCKDGFTVRYKDFVLTAKQGAWELLSYEGAEDVDLTTLTVMNRRVTSISDEITIRHNVTFKVNSEVSYSAALKEWIYITEE